MDRRNIQILPVDLCFWAFHTVCWESLGYMFFFQWFDWFLFVWRRCCSAHSGTSVLLPIDSWHFGRSKDVKGHNGSKVLKFVLWVGCMNVSLLLLHVWLWWYVGAYRICWMRIWTRTVWGIPSEIVIANYIKLQVANFAFTIQNWVPMIWNERGNLRKNVPILNSTHGFAPMNQTLKTPRFASPDIYHSSCSLAVCHFHLLGFLHVVDDRASHSLQLVGKGWRCLHPCECLRGSPKFSLALRVCSCW